MHTYTVRNYNETSIINRECFWAARRARVATREEVGVWKPRRVVRRRCTAKRLAAAADHVPNTIRERAVRVSRSESRPLLSTREIWTPAARPRAGALLAPRPFRFRSCTGVRSGKLNARPVAPECPTRVRAFQGDRKNVSIATAAADYPVHSPTFSAGERPRIQRWDSIRSESFFRELDALLGSLCSTWIELASPLLAVATPKDSGTSGSCLLYSSCCSLYWWTWFRASLILQTLHFCMRCLLRQLPICAVSASRADRAARTVAHAAAARLDVVSGILKILLNLKIWRSYLLICYIIVNPPHLQAGSRSEGQSEMYSSIRRSASIRSLCSRNLCTWLLFSFEIRSFKQYLQKVFF